MVSRSERIVSTQNGSNRLICNPLEKRSRVSEPASVLLNRCTPFDSHWLDPMIVLPLAAKPITLVTNWTAELKH